MYTRRGLLIEKYPLRGASFALLLVNFYHNAQPPPALQSLGFRYRPLSGICQIAASTMVSTCFLDASWQLIKILQGNCRPYRRINRQSGVLIPWFHSWSWILGLNLVSRRLISRNCLQSVVVVLSWLIESSKIILALWPQCQSLSTSLWMTVTSPLSNLADSLLLSTWRGILMIISGNSTDVRNKFWICLSWMQYVLIIIKTAPLNTAKFGGH
jgi:hypothetical protein